MKLSTLFFVLLVSLSAQAQVADERASAIADSVLQSMGGRQNWENTRCLRWNFFGRRILWWDKYTGNVRIEIPAKKLVLLSNINTKTARAFRDGNEIKQPDSVQYFNDRAYRIWANDSYWLIMPFKMKDPGVNLKFLGSQKDSLGNDCYLLELTFTNVGVTPQNKYHVYVDRKAYLVTEFDYFENYTDEKPQFRDPWLNYQHYGKILLADERGADGKLTDIAVLDVIPAGLFDHR